MQAGGSFTLTEALGSSPVGTVWAAVDASGRSATVAVLDPTVASDPPWRDAFAAAATALGASGPRLLSANFSASAPWAAFAADDGPGAERVLLTLGEDYQPTGRVTAGLGSYARTGLAASPPQLAESTGSWVSRIAAVRRARPDGSSTGYDADDPMESWGVRRWWWVGIAMVVLLVAGLSVVAWQRLPAGRPRADPSIVAPALILSAAPLRPGIEPPRPGEWPGWPRFGRGDRTQTVTLDRLGRVTLPAGWRCGLDESAEGFTKYACGGSRGSMGGDLIVRDCPQPCNDVRRAAMRAAEEAWGLQWRAAGANATLAETVRLNGDPGQYGLVLVAYFRSVRGGRVDRQLVLRIAAPESSVDTIHKLATAVRDTVKF
jgi:hypothetical protein